MKDFNQKVNDLFKFLYEGEFKRKDELDKILSFPVTLVTLQSGAAFFVFKQHITNWDFRYTNYDIAFFIIAALFVVCTASTVAFMVAVFHGPNRKYKHLPYAKQITEFKWNLIKYHRKETNALGLPAETDDRMIDMGAGDFSFYEVKDENQLLTDFNLGMMDRYQECSTRNAEINDKRNGYYYWVRTFIVFSTIFFFMVIIFGLIDFINMSKPDKQPQKPQTATQAPVKPTLAPAREVKEQPMPNIKKK